MAGLSSCKKQIRQLLQCVLRLLFACSASTPKASGLAASCNASRASMASIRRSGRRSSCRRPAAPRRATRRDNGAAQRILQRAVGIVQRCRLGRGPRPLVGRTGDEAVGMPPALECEIGLIERRGLQLERRRQSQPRKMIHDRSSDVEGFAAARSGPSRWGS